jgi:uncharacterized protein YdhG (YjbR/CyaY superfamily)
MTSRKPNDIDNYIRNFPADIQALLQQMRATIRQAAPRAVETISYMIPAFLLRGVLAYFAAFKGHIGFYPTSSGIAAFQKELAPYKSSREAVQFPFDKPLPLTLITKIVRFRVKEEEKRTASGL